jgi:glycosyltransferase involved in cell wall biosynthesis
MGLNLDEPLISVVLPTFNGARHLTEAIDGCLKQTWTNWELIIVDDHSTDETPEIVARYAAADDRIRPVRHHKNRKLPAALNTGFALARGEYCSWTSDDNFYEPDALKKMATVLDRNEKFDIVYTAYGRIDERGRPSSTGALFRPEDLGYRGNVVTPCFLFRRRVYDFVGGYAENLFFAEDYFFWLCAAARFRFQPLSENLYRYREHSNSLTAQRTEAVRQVTLTALEKALDRIELSERFLRAGIMIHAAGLYLHFREPKRARRLFLSAFLTAPWQVLRRTQKGMMVALFFGRKVAASLLSVLAERPNT